VSIIAAIPKGKQGNIEAMEPASANPQSFPLKTAMPPMRPSRLVKAKMIAIVRGVCLSKFRLHSKKLDEVPPQVSH
jgi:hypothetical protein